MKKLQILVPQYHEDEAVIKPLLDSIAIQQNVDFNDVGVIICSDGGEVILGDGFLNAYPFDIEYHVCPHEGVSATRQACLDRATADYVMFCDADDMFCNACGLWLVFREMGIDGGFDTLVSVFVEESRQPDGTVTYLNHGMDSTFVHGKIHRRQYLLDKNIRWDPSLTVHEDSYFNCLTQCCLPQSTDGNGKPYSPTGRFCQTPFYLWKWRDESVCRHDPKYILKTYNNMLDSNTALLRQLEARGLTDKARFYCTNMIYDAYYSMNTEQWINQENQEYRRATEARFREYYREFQILFCGMDEMSRDLIASQVRDRKVLEGMHMEQVTFNDWLSHIMSQQG